MQMIRHSGEVVAVNGDTVRVRIEQASACSACHAKGFCASAEAKEKFIDCDTDGETYQTGDRVEVMVQERLGMKAVLIAYVLPFVVIILTLAFLTPYMSEPVVGIVALAAAAGYFLILALASKRLRKVFTFKVRRAG
jgi:sigma-E factor negative regulatory protein RseC